MGWDTMFNSFYGCSNLISVSGDNNFENVKSLQAMFHSCVSLVDFRLENCKLYNIETYYGLGQTFQNTRIPTIDLSTWVINNIVDTNYMFFISTVESVIFPDNIKVGSLYRTFLNVSSLITCDLSNFDVSNLTTGFGILAGANNWTDSQYDDVLEKWSEQILPYDIVADFGDAKYQASSLPYKTILTDTYNWTITDGGPA